MAEGNPDSFLHVIRPEIDLPEGTSFDDDRVYEQGAKNLHGLIQREVLKEESDRALYLYRLVRKGRSQTGIFGCVSVEEYDRGDIRKHELTRPDKEDDRTRHMLTQSAHPEPVMLAIRPEKTVDALMDEAAEENKPLFDFTADDGVRHILWKISDTDPWEETFKHIPRMYIADGHHRCKGASRTAEERRSRASSPAGDEEYEYFPAVVFPMDQMEILPYNRLIHRIPDGLPEKLKSRFRATETDDPAPREKGSVCLYMEGSWWTLELPLADDPDCVEKLDVHRLQHYILEPMLDISDPRRDENISFVGGIRGTADLEKRVDAGEAELAVSMYPTAMEELADVADEGKLMPPKSTWFEPKLRSGMLVHRF